MHNVFDTLVCYSYPVMYCYCSSWLLKIHISVLHVWFCFAWHQMEVTLLESQGTIL